MHLWEPTRRVSRLYTRSARNVYSRRRPVHRGALPDQRAPPQATHLPLQEVQKCCTAPHLSTCSRCVTFIPRYPIRAHLSSDSVRTSFSVMAWGRKQHPSTYLPARITCSDLATVSTSMCGAAWRSSLHEWSIAKDESCCPRLGLSLLRDSRFQTPKTQLARRC